MVKRIVQLVGQPNSGKSEISSYLADSYGFTPVTVSGLIAQYANQRGLELAGRQDFNKTHAQMLKELGKYAISDAILDSPNENICVDGMRVPAHAEKLREFGRIVALDCPLETRFDRALKRARNLDRLTIYAFAGDEAQEYHSDDPFAPATLTVMEMADYRLDSSRPLAVVTHDVDLIVSEILEQ